MYFLNTEYTLYTINIKETVLFTYTSENKILYYFNIDIFRPNMEVKCINCDTVRNSIKNIYTAV